MTDFEARQIVFDSSEPATVLGHQRRRFVVSVTKAAMGCQDCGEQDPRVLDFHHRDPNTKLASVGSLVGSSHDRMQEELAKCDLLCANHHRIREAQS